MDIFTLKENERSLGDFTLNYYAPIKKQFPIKLYLTNQRLILIVFKVNRITISQIQQSMGLTQAEIKEQADQFTIEIKREIVGKYIFSLNSITLILKDGRKHPFITRIKTFNEPILAAFKGEEPEEKMTQTEELKRHLADYNKKMATNKEKELNKKPLDLRNKIALVIMAIVVILVIVLIYEYYGKTKESLTYRPPTQITLHEVTKCPRCNKPIKEKTNTVYSVDYKDGDTIFKNEYDEKCKSIVADSFYKIANKYYLQKDYENAMTYSSKAREFGSTKAGGIYDKSYDILDMIKHKKELSEKADSREDYRAKLRQLYLDKGYDIKVTISGKYNEYIKLSWILIDAVWSNAFEKGDLIKEIRGYGFKRVDLTNGYDYSVYYDL